MPVTVLHADARHMPLADGSVDAVVTDPPYGLEFMGREWDSFRTGNGFRRAANPADVDRADPFGRASRTSPEYFGGTPFQEFSRQWAAEAYRVLKPGGYLLAFGGTRTWHRLVCGIEDAGFEIRDTITWLYGSGFPKSLDVSKAIDKAAGAEREVVGPYVAPDGKARPISITPADFRSRSYQAAMGYQPDGEEYPAEALNGAPKVVTAPATDDARRWAGWGTALKPASEPIVVARKPLAGTVAGNVLAYGTGALNIAGCRVAHSEPIKTTTRTVGEFAGSAYAKDEYSVTMDGGTMASASPAGRWPSNVVLSHADACADGCARGCPVAELDRQSGRLTSGANPTRRGSDKFRDAYGEFTGQEECIPARGADSGGASRFFPTFRYSAKAPTAERPRGVDGTAHPTVKPLALMRWLVRLVTPPGGLVLDPFKGSGTTLEACLLEGFPAIGMDNDWANMSRTAKRIKRSIGVAVDVPLFDLSA